MMFLNNKLVMLASAITLLIIITSNTVLVTSSSESNHFVQHRQGRRLFQAGGLTKIADGLATRIDLKGKAGYLVLENQLKQWKSFNNKDKLQQFNNWKKKLLKEAAKEVVDEIIDQISACPVVG